jgi:hypothetical protein
MKMLTVPLLALDGGFVDDAAEVFLAERARLFRLAYAR